MRLWARLLCVIVIAQLAALAAVFVGSTVRARADTAAPQPIVVAIDPGHGGSPDNGNPALPFDPGAIAASNGLMEKVVTLDVGKRLADLLRADFVDAVLTRSDDRFLSVEDRERLAVGAHEELFVSVHCNSFPSDPAVGGSLVLYPNDSSLRFAQTLSDSLGRGLAPSGVGADGVQLRDNWWIHNPVPTATAEVAYLSNSHEAALLNTADFRQRIAVALRDGIEAYDPQIAKRRGEIIAWHQAHPGASASPSSVASGAPGAAPPTPSGSPWRTVIAWLLLTITGCALVRWRVPVARLALVTGAAFAHFGHGRSLRRIAARRRRRRVRAGGLLRESWTHKQSVYDELTM
jgi:N-acetylmuramoyl-L-alanine amidase